MKNVFLTDDDINKSLDASDKYTYYSLRRSMILLPLLASTLGVFFTLINIFTNSNMNKEALISFDIICLFIIGFSIFLKQTVLGDNNCIKMRKVRMSRVFIIISMLTLFNFILYMNPNSEVWVYVFLFSLFPTLGLDFKLCSINTTLIIISALLSMFINNNFINEANPEIWVLGLFDRFVILIFSNVILLMFTNYLRNYLTYLTAEHDSNIKKKQEEIENKKNKDIKEVNETNSTFLASISHEIRTPINVILGMNELMQRDAQNGFVSNDQILDYSNNIQVAGNTLLSLLNNILDFSKIESRKMELNEGKYDTTLFLKDILNNLTLKANEKGLNIKFDVDNNIPKELYGDEERLKQVLNNLITNAVKFTKEGIVSVSVKLKGTIDENAFLYFSVTDTGVGINADTLDSMINALQNLEEEEQRGNEGAGLGLNIAQGLLNMMNSKLLIKSEVDKGSTFSFTIEQKICTKEIIGDFNLSLQKATQKKYIQRFKVKNAKLLIVDDVEMNLKVTSNLIKNTGLDIDTALSGNEAIRKCQEKQYDIILMDHMMPDMDGIETAKIVRTINDYYRNCPIVALTANTSSGIKEKYLASGMNDYLVKPVGAIGLENIIQKWLPENKIEVLIEDNAISDEELTTLRQEQNNDEYKVPEIDYIDHDYAIEKLGSEAAFKESLLLFIDSVDERMILLQNDVLANNQEDFALQAHSLKSILRTIGAVYIADNAEFLEVKGSTLTSYELKMRTNELIEKIYKLKTSILTVQELSQREEIDYGEITFVNTKEITDMDLKDILNEALRFAKAFDVDDLENIAKKLDLYNLKEYAYSLEKLKGAIKRIDYEDCNKIVEEWIHQINEHMKIN